MIPGSDRSRIHRLLLRGLFLCYGIILLACLPTKPFWLDEVLQLIGTTTRSWQAMIFHVQHNRGAVPLGYLTQWPFVLAAGPSPFWARLPSAIFSVLSC